NYPNPFNPTTNIRYGLPFASKVTLKIYDILGREVRTLVNSVQAPGQYTVTLNAQQLASGVYFYRINAGNFSETKKLLLLR
ncbi:MAG: T9SS type A sorting domain-containing protein, partial [Bacteroidota bacterium]